MTYYYWKLVIQSQAVIKKWDRKQLLQSYYRLLLQSAPGITKYDRLLLQSAPGITKWDRLLLQSLSGIAKCDSDYKVRLNNSTNIFTFHL